MQDRKDEGLVHVFILDGNALAAEYLLDTLGKDISVIARLYRPQLPLQSGGEAAVFVLDNTGCELSVAKIVDSLKSQFPTSKVIVVGRQLPKHQVNRLIAIGVQGFVKHYDVPSELVLAVHAVSAGRMWIESELLQENTQTNTANPKRTDVHGDDEVTPREEEILELVKQRLSNKEIASILSIEVSTVKYHLSNIFSKLQIGSRDQLWQSSGLELIGASKLDAGHDPTPAARGEKRATRMTS